MTRVGAHRWTSGRYPLPVILGAAVAFSVTPAANATPLPAGCQQTDQTVTCTYAFTGDEQMFAVPAGVHHISVTATGASGGNAPNSGAGAIVTASLPVTPDSTLYVEVGGRGADGGSAGGKGGFNGGGNGGGTNLVSDASGGGGASDIRTLPRVQGDASMTSRLIVAGGGGGAGNAGNGGNAGSDGAASTRGAGGGKAGSDSAGGAGGPAADDGGGAGTTGIAGDGGNGGIGVGGGRSGANGGGGGGGLHGGGGGGGGVNNAWEADGGGGGGGSSLAGGGTVTVAQPGSAGSVTISYTVE